MYEESATIAKEWTENYNGLPEGYKSVNQVKDSSELLKENKALGNVITKSPEFSLRHEAQRVFGHRSQLSSSPAFQRLYQY